MRKTYGRLLILFLFVAGCIAVVRQREKVIQQLSLQDLFPKKEIIAPLPKKDPTSELTGYLKKKKISIEEVPIASGSALLVVLSGGTKVLFSVNKDIALQVDSLQIVRDRLTIEGRAAQKIDLRFSDPIVIY